MKRYFGLILLLWLSIGKAYALDEDWYQIEIIAFKNITAETLAAETWLPYPTLPAVARSIELKPYDNASGVPAFTRLPRKYFTLRREENALRNVANYEILMHVAWQQPLKHPNDAKPIHLYALPLDDILVNTPVERWQLNGTLTISETNYVNLKADFLLNLPTTELQHLKLSPLKTNLLADNQVMSFKLQQRRRMRAGDELQYLDHPLFGLLIKVTPV